MIREWGEGVRAAVILADGGGLPAWPAVDTPPIGEGLSLGVSEAGNPPTPPIRKEAGPESVAVPIGLSSEGSAAMAVAVAI